MTDDPIESFPTFFLKSSLLKDTLAATNGHEPAAQEMDSIYAYDSLAIFNKFDNLNIQDLGNSV